MKSQQLISDKTPLLNSKEFKQLPILLQLKILSELTPGQLIALCKSTKYFNKLLTDNLQPFNPNNESVNMFWKEKFETHFPKSYNEMTALAQAGQINWYDVFSKANKHQMIVSKHSVAARHWTEYSHCYALYDEPQPKPPTKHTADQESRIFINAIFAAKEGNLELIKQYIPNYKTLIDLNDRNHMGKIDSQRMIELYRTYPHQHLIFIASHAKQQAILDYFYQLWVKARRNPTQNEDIIWMICCNQHNKIAELPLNSTSGNLWFQNILGTPKFKEAISISVYYGNLETTRILLPHYDSSNFEFVEMENRISYSHENIYTLLNLAVSIENESLIKLLLQAIIKPYCEHDRTDALGGKPQQQIEKSIYNNIAYIERSRYLNKKYYDRKCNIFIDAINKLHDIRRATVTNTHNELWDNFLEKLQSKKLKGFLKQECFFKLDNIIAKEILTVYQNIKLPTTLNDIETILEAMFSSRYCCWDGNPNINFMTLFSVIYQTKSLENLKTLLDNRHLISKYFEIDIDLDQQILKAASSNSKEAISNLNLLIEYTADKKYHQINGMPLLHHAAADLNIELTIDLLKQDPESINIPDQRGLTALDHVLDRHRSFASYQSARMIGILLSNNATSNTYANEKHVGIAIAIGNKDIKFCAKLLTQTKDYPAAFRPFKSPELFAAKELYHDQSRNISALLNRKHLEQYITDMEKHNPNHHKTRFTFFGKTIMNFGYSARQKVIAARALLDFLDDANQSHESLLPHMGALTNGHLGEIYRAVVPMKELYLKFPRHE